jgi:opacity protein-like surface antigen
LKKLLLMAAMLAVLALIAAPVVAQVGFEVGDAENESGEIATENAFEIAGDNNNACLGTLQFGQTGNFTNQQGALQYASDADDLEFGAGELEFVPENSTACEQAVEQAAAASSTF